MDYVKTFKNLLLCNQKADDLETLYAHWLLEYYQVCSNDHPGMTLTYLTARANLVLFFFFFFFFFVWENAYAVD